MRRSNVMERRSPASWIPGKLKRRGKRVCAALLSVSMVLCHSGITGAANPQGTGLSEFELDSVTLYQAFQKAVAENEPIGDMGFGGESAGDYEELFGQDVYELYPEIEHKNTKVDLRVFARLGEDSEISLDHGYQVKDTDQIIFLVSNETDTEQKAVIYVNDEETGDKRTEVFTIAPKSSANSGEDLKSPSGNHSPESGTEVAGSGSQEPSGEEAVTEAESETTENRAEEGMVEEGAEGSEGSTEPAAGEDGSQDSGENMGEEHISQDSGENTGEETASQESGEDAGEGTASRKSGEDAGEETVSQESGEDTGTEDDSWDSGKGTGKETASQGSGETSEDEEMTRGSGEDLDETSGTEVETEGETEAGDSSRNSGGNTGDHGENTDEMASLSAHRVYRVAASLATPSDGTEAAETEKREESASPSDAHRELMTGTLYEETELNGNSVRAYVFRADQLGLTGFGDVYEQLLDDIVVRVSVPMGTFAADVELAVEKLAEDSEAYANAKTALDDSEEAREYDGMMALDIAFRDGSGEEIEPDREARVMIEMRKSALPDEIDLGSLAVHHLAEDEDKSDVEVQVVADAADEAEGTVEVNEEENLIAAFSVESFSTFTITWSSGWGRKTISVYYVDEDGREITCDPAPAQVDKDFDNNNKVVLSDYAYSIEGYSYQGARLGDVNGEEVTHLKGDSSNWGWSYSLKWSSDGSTWKDLGDHSAIYLIYKGSAPTPPTTTGQSQNMAHDKKAVRREDGTYDLTLTISGAFGSESRPALLDVIYVVDESSSMTNNRFTFTKNAIMSLTNALTANAKIDPCFSVVTFSGTEDSGRWNDAEIKKGWTRDPSSIENVRFKQNGGTNYQAGIRTAKELLSMKREHAMTAVIFISDGDPTFYYNNEGKTTGYGSSYDKRALEAAKTEVSTLNTDYFFTVGVGESKNYQKLKDLKDAAPETTTKKFFSTSEADKNSLTNAFYEIQDSITTFLCSDVTVTDTLSDEVTIVTGADGIYEPLEILVTREEEGGNVVTVASGESPLTVDGNRISADYAQVDGKTRIIMDFPDDYELKKGYTYQVRAHIEATEAAYEKYRSDGWNLNYQEEPEEGTGTHADRKEQGIYSNEEAVVSYKYKEEDKTEEYFKPVIRLAPGELKIEKTISGLDSDHLNLLINGTADNRAGIRFKAVFSWSGKTDEITIPLKDLITGKTEKGIHYEVTKADDGKYTIWFKGLSPDTGYVVTEESADVDGYILEQKSSQAQGTVGKGEVRTASFENNYTRKPVNITVTKEVKGNMANADDSFEFELSYIKEGKTETETFRLRDITAHPAEGTYSIAVPAGSMVTVKETGAGEGYRTTYRVNGEAPVTGREAALPEEVHTDVTISFTNEKEVLIPTGLFHNRRPYLLMLILMAMSTIALLGTTLYKKVLVPRDEEQE